MIFHNGKNDKENIGLFRVSRTHQLLIRQARARLGKKQIWISSMPKSGTTTMYKRLLRLSGFKEAQYTRFKTDSEQDLDDQQIGYEIRKNLTSSLISTSHTKFNWKTFDCMYKYNLKPIILFRNLRDCLVSIVDHWERTTVMPFCHMTDTDLKLLKLKSDFSPLAAATTLVGPWYLHFYLSWERFRKELADDIPDKIKPIFIDFNSFIGHENEKLPILLEDLGLKSKNYCLETLLQTKGNMNVGKKGRGVASFKNDIMATKALNNLLSCYPQENFELLMDT